jgi:chitin synthase
MSRPHANTVAVRALVEQRLQTELTGEKKAFLDRAIDNELANM